MSKFRIELLKRLPREPEAPITTVDLAAKLRGHWGKANSLDAIRKKIKNNLEAIAKEHPDTLHKDTKNKNHLYRLKENAPMLLTPMSQEQMMAFGLLSKHGTELLTTQAYRSLSPFFEAAKDKAEFVAQDAGFSGRASKSKAHLWLEKIAVVPAVLSFCPPMVDEKIKQIVHQALLLESRLELTVVHSPSMKQEVCLVSPLALVQQGVRTYLIGKKANESKAQRFLLTRIIAAREVLGTLETPKDWSLEKFLEKGIGHSVFQAERYGKTVEVELEVDADSQWIKETPLAPDPVITEHTDGRYTMRVKVKITEELVHWLLSMAYHVKVIKPEFLAARLKEDHKKSLAMYK